MSIFVPLGTMDVKTRMRLDRQLRVREKSDPRNLYKNIKEVAAYRVDARERIALPFQWAFSREIYRGHRRGREEFAAMSSSFCGELRPEQQQIQKEAVAHLNRQGSILIAVYPGGGKTITSLSICSRIGMRTMVLVNRVVLMDQWRDSITRFFQQGVRVQVVEAKDTMDDAADVYIMNALNVPKRPPEEYARIGTVVVDEVHMMITQVFVKSLTYIAPRYLIGLSATPYRPDGLDVLLDMYFGEARIVRRLHRNHAVYVAETGIEIEGEKDERGKLMWNSVLQAQMTNPTRNDFIRRLCLFFAERSILILCKRVEQIVTLRDLLAPDATTTTLKGNETEYDHDARILIASIQKVGTGFSHDRLDMLILACDTEEYFLQYLGRVFRRPDVVPIVIDIVDKNPVLRRHARTRRGVYTECGGTVHPFSTMFPEFKIIS
jgi:superfamily II DNA or RNA helicase